MSVVFADCIAKPFYTVHRAVQNNKYRHYKLKGGRGGCKSSYVGLEIPYQMMKDPLANAVVMRKQAVDLKKSVYKQIKWSLNKLGVRHLWHCTTSPMEMVYKETGQSIIFAGMDDPEDSKSIKFEVGYCKYAWYEEYTEFNEEDKDTINPSLMRGGDYCTAFYTWNPPKSVQSWVNKEVAIPDDDTLIHHSVYTDVPEQWLGKAFLDEAEHMQKVNPEKYANIYMGAVTGTGGEVFRNVKSDTITDEQIKQFDRIYRGMDFGYAVDALAYGEMHYDKTRHRLYIYDEIYAVGMSNRTAVNEIKKRVRGSEQIIADSAEPRTINEFRELGLYGILPAKKGPDSVDHGVKWLQDLEQIIIDPVRCPNTFREFCGYELDRDKDGNFKAQYPDKNNHTIDMVRYAMNDVILQRNIKFY